MIFHWGLLPCFTMDEMIKHGRLHQQNNNKQDSGNHLLTRFLNSPSSFCLYLVLFFLQQVPQRCFTVFFSGYLPSPRGTDSPPGISITPTTGVLFDRSFGDFTAQSDGSESGTTARGSVGRWNSGSEDGIYGIVPLFFRTCYFSLRQPSVVVE